MTFEETVLSCDRLRPHFRKGLEALGKDRVRVTIKDTRRLSGSVNIEAAQREEDGEARTWDYGIGVRCGKDDLVVWLEVHSADSLHIDSVLGKMESLLAFLEGNAKRLKAMRSRFVWLATGRVYLPPDGRERRRLNARGLLLRSKKLDLTSL